MVSVRAQQSSREKDVCGLKKAEEELKPQALNRHRANVKRVPEVDLGHTAALVMILGIPRHRASLKVPVFG